MSDVAREFSAEVVRFDSQQGFCRAANAGVRAAAGEVVELLNDDTEVTPGWADAALSGFADASVAAVTPLVLQYGEASRIDSAGDSFHLFGIARKREHGRACASRSLTRGRVFGASGSSSFFRREVYLSLGGLPEEFGAYFDDIDLSFRLNRAGYQVIFEPTSRVHHRVSSSHGPPRGALLRMQSRNEEMVFWRNLRDWELLLAMPGHAAVLVGKALRRWREGQLRPWLEGRLRAWGEMGEIVRHRRRLQRLALAANRGAV